MKIFLDSSDVDEIQKAVDTGLIDGVTTNPSLMLKAGRDPREVLMEICELFSWDSSVSAEVSGDTAEDMLDQAFYVEDNSRLGCQIHLHNNLDGLKVRLAPVSE